MRTRLMVGFLIASVIAGGNAMAQTTKPAYDEANSPLTGAPKDPSPAWSIAAGGRMYDNWWMALGVRKPVGAHPAYPASSEIKGEATFRCKECHGWDYRGRDGEYATGKHATDIKGIRGAAGRTPTGIATMLRAAPHGYTPQMIADADLMRLALFVSRGQHDVRRIIDARKGEIRGNAANGRGIFQTTCATCHGYDGRLLNWGTKEEPEYVGTAVEISAAEVLHKIRNGHPGAAMVNLRAFSLETAADVLAYAKSLPTK